MHALFFLEVLCNIESHLSERVDADILWKTVSSLFANKFMKDLNRLQIICLRRRCFHFVLTLYT